MAEPRSVVTTAARPQVVSGSLHAQWASLGAPGPHAVIYIVYHGFVRPWEIQRRALKTSG